MVHFYFILEDFIITLHITYKEIIFREKHRVSEANEWTLNF